MKSNVILDSEDINRLVLNMPLATMDKEIERYRHLLTIEENEVIRFYWQEQVSALEIAIDIKMWCNSENINIAALTKPSKPNYDDRYLKLIAENRLLVKHVEDLSGQLTYLQGKLNQHIDKSKKKKGD